MTRPSPHHRDVAHPPDPPQRVGWYQRWYAAAMARTSPHYDQLVNDRKEALFAPLTGVILEIGPGTGPNLKYFRPDTHWIGVEPNPAMHPYLQQEAAELGRPIELRNLEGDRLPAADNSVDAVVSTLVLCTVPDPAATVGEIVRVLKPGGRFVFIEHVAAPRHTGLRRLQRWVRPLWWWFTDGCHPDRETGRTIEQGGFSSVDLERFSLPLSIVKPHIAGVAFK
jgi:SAM-dependent methyltransferase